MARKPRIQYPGAFYHIIVRGNQRQNIFLNDADRLEFIKRLKRYKKKCGFVLYAYVLMSNHVHLLLETPKDPIARIMQMINFTYTQYYFLHKCTNSNSAGYLSVLHMNLL